jgi:hypothetical protein
VSDEPIIDKPRGWRLRVSPEVSLADILAVVGIGVPLLVWGAKMDTRVEQVERLVERARTEQTANDSRQDAERERDRRELRDEVREINRKLDAIMAPRVR